MPLGQWLERFVVQRHYDEIRRSFKGSSETDNKVKPPVAMNRRFHSRYDIAEIFL